VRRYKNGGLGVTSRKQQEVSGSLDANTQKEAIAKAKELVYEREGKRYRKWVCSKVRTSELTPELSVEDEEDKKEKEEGIKKQRR